MVNGPKHFWNPNDITFTIFVHPGERNWSWKSPSEWYKKFLGLFVNLLAANNKNSLLNRGKLQQHFQMQLSQKRKIFSQFFLHFQNLDSFFNIFKKKRPSELIYFWAYGLRKTWLDKCLKSRVSEVPFKSNIVTGPKHCWNLNDSTFTIFIDPCEGNSVGNIIS